MRAQRGGEKRQRLVHVGRGAGIDAAASRQFGPQRLIGGERAIAIDTQQHARIVDPDRCGDLETGGIGVHRIDADAALGEVGVDRLEARARNHRARPDAVDRRLGDRDVQRLDRRRDLFLDRERGRFLRRVALAHRQWQTDQQQVFGRHQHGDARCTREHRGRRRQFALHETGTSRLDPQPFQRFAASAPANQQSFMHAAGFRRIGSFANSTRRGAGARSNDGHQYTPRLRALTRWPRSSRSMRL